MEIKYLRLVAAVVESGNLANSAERLFLTQSALSHQLKDLEDRVGFKVFHRQRHQWKLTREGQEVYALAKDVLDRIAVGLEKIQHIQQGTRGSIRLSTECYSFYQGLPAFIQRMGYLYPQVAIQLKVEATHHAAASLLADELDIALVTQCQNKEALVYHPWFEDELLAVMHQDHPLAAQPHLAASDFAHQHLIIHSYPLETVSVYQLFLQPAGVIPQKTSALPLTEVALEMVDAGMGISCFPAWALRAFQLSPHLVTLPLGPQGTRRTHYVAHRKAEGDKEYLQAFVAALLGERWE